jgi:hypothetical protein
MKKMIKSNGRKVKNFLEDENDSSSVEDEQNSSELMKKIELYKQQIEQKLEHVNYLIYSFLK